MAVAGKVRIIRFRDMKQFERRAYLADKSAADARWQNTEHRRRQALYDDGGAHDGILTVSAKDCVYNARGG